MTPVAQLVEALAQLAGAVAWPALILFLLWRAGPELGDFFRNLSEFTLKGGGFEASAKRRQADAAAALAAAAGSRAEPGPSPAAAAGAAARAAVEIVATAATPRNLARLGGASVLWVDNNPDNNRYERAALEAVGLRFRLAASTEEAEQLAAGQPFEAIISDMDRPGDPRAGYSLLERLRARGNQTPFIIYAGVPTAEQAAEATRRGAYGSTGRPDELFGMVLAAVLGTRR